LSFVLYRRCLQVPQGHVWLQGDNTLNSTDSRHYGPVPYALLKGRAFCKVHWRLPRCGTSSIEPSIRNHSLGFGMWSKGSMHDVHSAWIQEGAAAGL